MLQLWRCPIPLSLRHFVLPTFAWSWSRHPVDTVEIILFMKKSLKCGTLVNREEMSTWLVLLNMDIKTYGPSIYWYPYIRCDKDAFFSSSANHWKMETPSISFHLQILCDFCNFIDWILIRMPRLLLYVLIRIVFSPFSANSGEYRYLLKFNAKMFCSVFVIIFPNNYWKQILWMCFQSVLLTDWKKVNGKNFIHRFQHLCKLIDWILVQMPWLSI